MIYIHEPKEPTRQDRIDTIKQLWLNAFATRHLQPEPEHVFNELLTLFLSEYGDLWSPTPRKIEQLRKEWEDGEAHETSFYLRVYLNHLLDN